jgi:hypothetical protein
MTTNSKQHWLVLNLQLFAEGGDGGTGAGNASAVNGGFAASESDNPLANVKYGIKEEDVQNANAQKTDDTTVVDRKAEFDKLIKGEYKDLFGDEVQNIVKQRLKGSKEQIAKLESLTPSLELLSKKYGVDATDAEALAKAIEEDNTFYEDEALEMGISVDELKRIRKMERENKDLKRQVEEIQARENGAKLYNTWLAQAEETKKFFPNFDFEAEMQNPRFRDLLQAHVDVKTAFQVLHQDEIMPAAMQYAAKTVEKKLTDNIIANGARPNENGISSQSASVVKTDVSQFTDADIDEIIRRVRNGESIKL